MATSLALEDYSEDQPGAASGANEFDPHLCVHIEGFAKEAEHSLIRIPIAIVSELKPERAPRLAV